MWTRRTALAGGVAGCVTSGAPTRADDLALFRTGRLSRNRAAAQFERVAQNARWPAVALMSPEGARSPEDLQVPTVHGRRETYVGRSGS